VAGRRPPGLPRCGGRGRRLVAARRAPARVGRPRPGTRVAGVPRGLPAPPVRRRGQRAGAGGPCRGVRAAVRRAGPRDARARARGRGARRVRTRRGGHAPARRGGRGRARRRGDDPDLRRVGVLFPGERVQRGARLRACLRVVRPDRGVRRAVRKPLHARLLPRRVRRGAPVAGAMGRRRGDAAGLDRGLRPLAAGDGRRSARGSGRAQGQAGPRRRGDGSAGPSGAVRGGAAVPRRPGARPRRRAEGGRAARALAAPGASGTQARTRTGTRAAGPRPRPPRRA